MHRLRAIIQIQRTLQLAAVAICPASGRTEGRVGHVVPHELARLAGPGQADLADAALGIAHVVGHAATRVGQRGQAARLAVGIAQRAGNAVDGLHLAGDLAEAVVAVLGAATGVQHLPQTPLGEAACLRPRQRVLRHSYSPYPEDSTGKRIAAVEGDHDTGALA